jgi:hypothetical protein
MPDSSFVDQHPPYDSTTESLKSDPLYSNRREKIQALYKDVQAAICDNQNDAGWTDEIQVELGRWVNILSDLSTEFPEDPKNNWWQNLTAYARKGSVDPSDMLDRTELAIQLLLKKPGPSLNLVREMRYEIKRDLCWNGGPFQRLIIRLNGGSASMTVVWGALCTTLIGLPLLIYFLRYEILVSETGQSIKFLLLNDTIVLGTAVPAFLGAVVSIIGRLRDFENARSTDPKLLFMTAFFKPYIGMITGLFIVSALAIGIGTVGQIHLVPETDVNVPWPDLKVYYFLYVIGFLAGFSERLTTDFVETAEERFSGRSRSAGGAVGQH